MSKTVNVIENPLDDQTWKQFETEDILEFIMQYYKVWPQNARIYNRNVVATFDVTPANEKDIETLSKLEGPFYIVVFPGEAITIISVILAIITLAVYILFQKKAVIPTTNETASSSNNSLSDRTNKARVNGRIEDIYGTVRSIPTLLALPYKFYKNNIEYEHSYMCIGRGKFAISDIREDTTLLSQIQNAALGIYWPETSPNSGSPIKTIGDPISIPIKTVIRYSSVNGQTLPPEGKLYIVSDTTLIFGKTGKISIQSGAGYDFRDYFNVGDSAIITGTTFTNSGMTAPNTINNQSYNLNGTYTITEVSELYIVVSSPSTVSVDWGKWITANLDTPLISGSIESDSHDWTGPFYTERKDITSICCNFVAEQGIYGDNGSNRIDFPVVIELRVTPVDDNYNPIASPSFLANTIRWNRNANLVCGLTIEVGMIAGHKFKVEAKRLTAKTVVSGYTITEDVKWRDMYSFAPVNKTDFGNITTVQSLSVGTASALSVSERKLNMLVIKKQPELWANGVIFSGNMNDPGIASNDVADILLSVCTDSKIGNRLQNEIDLIGIYDTVQAIKSYFGTSKVAEFCYTFDASDLSFEDIISTICDSINCIGYRRGNLIKIAFERLNDASTILFNHRNKIPGTETRTVSFGNIDDNDGVEYQYINPEDESTINIYLPSDQSATNAKSIESKGVRNYQQAYFNAHRLYNKIKYQTMDVEFEATQEANVCLISDRILVSDGTRSGSFEGEIIEQNGLELYLSQDLDLLDEISYTIFLQYYDGTTNSIPITKTSVKNKIILNSAPNLPLVTDYDRFAKTTFIVTSNTDTRTMAFIVTEKTPKGVLTSTLKATNYDERYYQNDKDYINGIIS